MSTPSKTPTKRTKPVVAPEPAPITEEPVKRRGPKVAPCEKPMRYTWAEIEPMDDAELAREFTRITAWSELHCSHCKGCRPIESHWMVSIRKQCKKLGGLFEEMKLPGICNKQTLSNAARSKGTRDAYNAYYRVKNSEKVTEDELAVAYQVLRDRLTAEGHQVRYPSAKFI